MTVTLADRLRMVREELYGVHGAPMLAEEIGVSTRKLLACEEGEPMHPMTMLRFLVATNAEAGWLLRGEGPKYQR